MWARLGFASVASLSLSACGSGLYAWRVTRATDELARAEQLDAARRAPYEYQFAVEHLQKARTEAAEADFGDALRLAQIAQEYARRAVQVAQRVEPSRPPAAPESP